MKISIIGAGNVAWHTAFALHGAGHQIEEVYSRHLENAQQLASHFSNSQAQDHLNFENS
ncbi:MAG: NAD(P)-binding domain-containing protein, partial [Bacteroidota bacterium]